jgi:hypothetical protein
MRITPSEFRARPLRVHAVLHDVPLEDVWAIPLAGGGPGRTVRDLRTAMAAGEDRAPGVVRLLFRLRWRLGAWFGWDASRPEWKTDDAFTGRLSAEDRARSQVLQGTPDGKFSVLYRFEDEQLAELRNATVHAFASISIQPVPGGYLAYLGVFVQPVHGLTSLYMAAIRPFRRWVVYPAIIRTVQAVWAKSMAAALPAAG